MRAPKTLNLPRPKELKSNKLEAIQEHLRRLCEELDRVYKLMKDDTEVAGEIHIDLIALTTAQAF